MRVNRREFLAGTGALVVGFAVSQPRAIAQAAQQPPLPVDNFLRINANGTVTAFTSKVELGTGVSTALRQMVAEELEVSFDSIEWIQGDTAQSPAQGGTFGSTSVSRGGTQMRQAAATARDALLGLAAQKLNLPKDQLMAVNGSVVAKNDASKKVSYAELIGSNKFNLPLDPKAPLKSPDAFKVIGKPIRRPDIAEKVMANFSFVHDVKVPGMLHGRVIRPPMGSATTLLSVDESSIKDIPGAKVVQLDNFLGVVAATEWDAVQAAKALKVNWGKAAGLPTMDKLVEVMKGLPIKDKVIANEAGAEDAVAKSKTKVEGNYFWPFQNHGSIGPSCAVADVRADGATVWSGTQFSVGLQGEMAKLVGLEPAKVRVIYTESSGCYGRLFQDDAAADAVLLSKAVGKPVRVQWMRHDEHGWAYKGPAMNASVKAGLDEAGNVTSWVYDVWTPSHVGTPVLGKNLEGWSTPAIFGDDTADLYKFPGRKIVVHQLERNILRYGNLRTLGALQSAYFAEAFVDEVAAAAKADAVEFRLRYLKEPRLIEVLKAVAKQAGWQSRPAFSQTQSGTLRKGRGVAVGEYGGTQVAAVAEVTVDTSSGKIKVDRFVVAHDCGLVVNPDGLRNQIEGNVLQSVGRTLKEEVTFGPEGVSSLDWNSYPILTFAEIPEVETVLLSPPNVPISGGGEPASLPVPGAIANAVFDAIGKRLRSVPFTPERVLEAIKRQA